VAVRSTLALALLAGLAGGACSFALDFDELSDLRCPCLPEYVCLVQSDRCVPRRSVEDFKSCSPDAENPDDLCKMGSICVNYAERGHRCLPSCQVTNYSTSEAAERVRAQCPEGTTCWDTGERGGVCDEGECADNPNTCPGTQRCVKFNGAGVCFTTCEIFVGDNSCAADQLCHPIGDSSVVSCVPQGMRDYNEICSDADPCKKLDVVGRPLVCDRPAGSSSPRRCLPICAFGDGSRCRMGETCVFARSMVDPVSGASLGVCLPQ
jgi:hypothetical protein